MNREQLEALAIEKYPDETGTFLEMPNQSKVILQRRAFIAGYSLNEGAGTWVRASERLPEIFPISTCIRYINDPFRYVGGFYEVEDGKTLCHVANHNGSKHLTQDQFQHIEWLDESQSSPTNPLTGTTGTESCGVVNSGD